MNNSALLLAEIRRRQNAQKTAPVFLDPDFKAQTDFIVDPARFKAALCTRRSGKSYGAGCYLFKEAWENPGCTCFYIALTRESAKAIMWRPVLKELDRKQKLGCEFNETTLEVRLPNGSLIKLVGADASQDEMQKLLGQKFKLVVIDECASFKQDLKDLVHKMLEPAMKDEDGTICMLGTPGNIKAGLYFRITSTPPQLDDTDAPWSVHRWGQLENPYMRDKYIADLAKIEAERPRFKETANYKQMWLGQWTVEEDALVYKFDRTRNTYAQLPKGDYRIVLGCDLGFGDDSSFVLCAYQAHDPVLYVLEAFSAPGMTITKVAETIKEYQKRWSIDNVVIDGANKQAVEEMRQHHDLAALEAADKRHKFEFIDLLNDDLIQGRVKIFQDCESIIEELSELVLDEKVFERTRKRIEHPSCSNHLCDALLYAWRHTYQYLATLAPVVHKPGTPDWLREEDERMERATIERNRPRSEFEPSWSSDPFPS